MWVRWSRSCCRRTVRRRWRIVAGCVTGRGLVRGVSAEESARPGLSEGRLRGDGTYLVTGGLGGIGRELAVWLAEHGAGAIVLNGRRPPDPEVEAALEGLRARGVRVEVEMADVSDGEAVEAMLGRIGERLPPLAGVIHSVGVLSDASLANQDWGRFERVLGPKVVGAWHLHRATRGWSLTCSCCSRVRRGCWAMRGRRIMRRRMRFWTGWRGIGGRWGLRGRRWRGGRGRGRGRRRSRGGG